jgi:hypothetical protein
MILVTPSTFVHRPSRWGGGSCRGFPGWLPVNAGAEKGVNMQRPQRAARGRTTLMAGRARRRLGWPGRAVSPGCY